MRVTFFLNMHVEICPATGLPALYVNLLFVTYYHHTEDLSGK